MRSRSHELKVNASQWKGDARLDIACIDAMYFAMQSRRVSSMAQRRSELLVGQSYFVELRAYNAKDAAEAAVHGYRAASGKTGSLSMSRASCWIMMVAFMLAPSFLKRSSEASVSARLVLKVGTPSVS